VGRRGYPPEFRRKVLDLVEGGTTSWWASGIDRGCPLGTGIDPSMWHVNGTTTAGHLRATKVIGAVVNGTPRGW
jgi:hypothetical protein